DCPCISTPDSPSLHDALPICTRGSAAVPSGSRSTTPVAPATGSVSTGASSSGGGASSLPQSDIEGAASADAETVNLRTQVQSAIDRKSTRLNSSHDQNSYAVF